MSIIQGSAKGNVAGGFYPTTIDQSLRFNDDDSAFLSWTPASAGNRKTWTFSTWVKRTEVADYNQIFNFGYNNPDECSLRFRSNDVLEFTCSASSVVQARYRTNAVYRDVSAWYHIVLAIDTTQATASNRVKLFVNGEQVTSFSSETVPAQNAEFQANTTYVHEIGRYYGTVYPFDGYLAETHFIDGQALDATAFGEFKNGVWIPKAYSGSYGTNGFYLDYSNGASIGADSSGNSNNWTPTNLASTDISLDSPTNNFATLNPLVGADTLYAVSYTLSEGNLKNITNNDRYGKAPSSIGMSSGKWYWEIAYTGGSNVCMLGISNQTALAAENHLGAYTGGHGYYSANGNYYRDGSSVGYGSTYTTGDIIGVTLDADSGTLTFYKNNVSQGTATSSLDTNETWFAVTSDASGSASVTTIINFGQDSSFAGNKTPQGYTDANGIGDFYYAPPAGYLALCTANLPEPVIGPNSATTADEHFNSVLYTGDGGASQAITGVGFQSDFTWIKNRSEAHSHQLYDAVRGAGVGKSLKTNATDAEGTYDSQYGYVGSLDSDGFTVTKGSDIAYFVNKSSVPYVAWNWKANGSGSTNTDGSITSTVSANVDAGFSIVSYTGNGTSGATVGHGLSQAPDMMIVKCRSFSPTQWVVYHSDLGATKALYIAGTNSVLTSSGFWNNTEPTSSVITLGPNAYDTNTTSHTHIAYCFHSVEGYSKFGSYTGNGSTDGPFVYTGFRPAFVMIKSSSDVSDWFIRDTSIDPANVADTKLSPNTSSAEATIYVYNTDILSSGFKIRDSWKGMNTSGATYIYMAFAESPFKYSVGR